MRANPSSGIRESDRVDIYALLKPDWAIGMNFLSTLVALGWYIRIVPSLLRCS